MKIADTDVATEVVRSFLETEIVLCDTAIALLSAGETEKAIGFLTERVLQLRKDHGQIIRELARDNHARGSEPSAGRNHGK